MSKPNTNSRNKYVFIALGVIPVTWAALQVHRELLKLLQV